MSDNPYPPPEDDEYGRPRRDKKDDPLDSASGFREHSERWPCGSASAAVGTGAGIISLACTPLIGFGVLLVPIIAAIMLLFWRTRLFGLGVLIAVGIALLLLFAICGGGMRIGG